MGRKWNIAKHYLAALGSYLFSVPYTVYKGAKAVYHLAKREYIKARDDLIGALASFYLWPVYSLYRAAAGTLELAGGTIPWYK